MKFFFTHFFSAFYYLDCISLSITLLILVLLFRKLRFAGNIPVLFYFIIFSLGTFIFTILSEKGLFNGWLYNIMPLLISIPLFIFFRNVPQVKQISQIGIFVFIGMILFYFITYEFNINQYLNPAYYLFFSFFILFNSVGYLLQEIKEMREGVIFSKIEFWFIASLFIYATSCALIWSVYSYLEEKFLKNPIETNPAILWAVAHNSILFVHCFVFSSAIIVAYRQKWRH